MPRPNCQILCVDDHDDTSEMLQILLASPDYEVRTARSVEEAVLLASSVDFDLYVLDKRLPDGTGLQLCQQLNALTPGIPCVFYTGDAYEIHKQEALEAGADAFIAKPDLEGLIKAVEHLLSRRECAATTQA